MAASTSRAMSAIPNEEQPILEALINIRNRLTALKKDSSDYVKPQDVQQLYQSVIKQVTRLNAVRDELAANDSSTNGSSGRPQRPGAEQSCEPDTATLTEINRVDTTLNDVFSLLSLFFLTIGKSRETPATFCQLGSMKQLLGHLAESGIYTEADLQPFSQRLSELRAIIKRDAEQGKHPSQLTKLMMKKIDGCEKVLRSLEKTLSVLSVELVPIHQRLIHIRRQLIAAAAKPKLTRHEIKHEIKALQEELRKIDGKRVDGKFLGPGGSSVPAGQAILVGILEDCFEIVHDINVRNDEVPMTLQPIYDRLSEIRSQLEHLVLTHRWTLRETDLWNYQVTLKEIDRLRVGGKFVDSENKQPEGQLVVLYLLRRCYGLIYRLIASSEPISEELMPISNKLSTISKCLKEVSKYGGPFTMRDLYPYRLALHQIDSMRSPVLDKDGKDTGVRKWLGRDGSIPEGQAILRAQYEEVEQTINEMLNREEDEDDEDEEEEDDEEAVEEGDYEGSSLAASSGEEDTDSPRDSASGRGSPGTINDASFPASPLGEISNDPMSNPMSRMAATPPVPLGSPPSLQAGSHSMHDFAQSLSASLASSAAMQPASVSAALELPSADTVLPAGAAPLAVPQPFLAMPSSGNVNVVPGLTAIPGEPAAKSATPNASMFSPDGSMSAAASAGTSEEGPVEPSLDRKPSPDSQARQPVSSIEALASHVSNGLSFGANGA